MTFRRVGAGATLSMTLPSDADAPSRAMLTATGGIVADETAAFVLDVAAFCRKHSLASMTLVECGKISSDALQTLADNLTFAGGISRGNVAVVDGLRLVYTSPQKPGMIITVE